MKIKSLLLGLFSVAATLSAGQAAAVGSPTYTYLRCFYRIDTNMAKPAATYEWGLDPATGGYYKVVGNWWKDGLLSWENMFYSNTSQATLNSVCQSTLSKKGISRPVTNVFAADTSLSLNYTIWSNDSASQTSTINKIVVFGDSLSDNQNMYNATQWKLPNKNSWSMGRFSNDKVWVEYLAGTTKLPMYNWAVAGAAGDNYMVIPGVSTQVDSWLTYMRSAPNYKASNTLFTMLIGGNDLVNYGRTVDSIIAAEQAALEKIIAAGGRNILMLNLPDVSRAPVFKMRTDAAAVKSQVDALNIRIAQLRDSLQAKYGPSLVIRMFDTSAMFADLLNNPSKYGVTNTTMSCLNINTDSTTNYMSTQYTRPECTNPNTFVFWDTLHPTTNTHKLLANYASTFVKANFANMPAF